jgi:hypothetical protein
MVETSRLGRHVRTQWYGLQNANYFWKYIFVAEPSYHQPLFGAKKVSMPGDVVYPGLIVSDFLGFF